MTHSFPTRRSSDLPKRPKWNGWKGRRRFDGRIESSLTQRREEKWPKGRFPDNLTQRHREVGCVRDVAFSLLGERLAGLCPALFSQRWGGCATSHCWRAPFVSLCEILFFAPLRLCVRFSKFQQRDCEDPKTQTIGRACGGESV